jgi:hypothetical protein
VYFKIFYKRQIEKETKERELNIKITNNLALYAAKLKFDFDQKEKE